jgi:hypothetical protein
MAEDVFKRNPDKGQDEECRLGEGLIDFCGGEREKGPEERQHEHEKEIDDDAENQGEVAVMRRDRRNPIDEHRIECESGCKPQEKGMFRLFFQDNSQKRDEGDPGEKGKIELRKRESSEGPAQQSQKNIENFNLQCRSPHEP